MTCHAIGHLREVTMGPDILDYFENSDETSPHSRVNFRVTRDKRKTSGHCYSGVP